MSKNNVFDQDFSEIVDFDDSLDVNEILEGSPDDVHTDTDEGGDVDNDDKDTDNKPQPDKEEPLSVEKALESQVDDDDGDDDVDADDDTDDKDVDDVDKDPAPDDTETSSSDAPFTVIFARDMMEQGLLSSFDEEEFNKDIEEHGEAAALRHLLKNEIDTNIETAKSDLDEGYQQYLNLVGKGVEPDAALNLTTLQENLSSIDESTLESEDNESLRKEVLTNYFQLTTQFSDKKIEKMVQRSIDLGDDVDESKDYLKEMKTLISDQIKHQEQEAEKQTELRRQEQQRQLETLKDTINSMSEVIPGQKINKPTKDKLYGMITKPIEDKNGRTTNALWAKRSEDPLHFDAKLAYLVDTGFFEKDKPWDKLKTVKTSKEASRLEDYLSDKKNTTSRKGSPPSLNSTDPKKISEIVKSTRSILNK